MKYTSTEEHSETKGKKRKEKKLPVFQKENVNQKS